MDARKSRQCDQSGSPRWRGQGTRLSSQRKDGLGERVQGCWGNKALRDRLADGKAVGGGVLAQRGEERGREGGSQSCVLERAWMCACVRVCACVWLSESESTCARVPWSSGFQPKSGCEKSKKKKKSSRRWCGSAHSQPQPRQGTTACRRRHAHPNEVCSQLRSLARTMGRLARATLSSIVELLDAVNCSHLRSF